MKIIHTADWHIDANITEAGRCLQHLCDKAAEIMPDLIIIAGDMFNSADVRLDTKAARLAMSTVVALKNYSKHGVIILIGTPSHDGLAATIFENIDKVMVAMTPGTHKYENFVVSVLPQPTKQYLESQLTGDIEDVNLAMSEALTSICGGFGVARAEVPFHKTPHICVGHFSVSGAHISPTQQMMGYDIELSTYQLQLADPTLWCLGHIHHAQDLMQDQDAPGIFYSGSLYRVDFGERESDKGFWEHNIISEDGLHDVQSFFHQTPAATMSKVNFDLKDDEDSEDFSHAMIDDHEIEEKMQVELKMYADQVEAIDTEAIKADLIHRGAKEVDVIIQRIPRPNVRSAKILAVDSLREKLIARAEITDDNLAPGILDKANWLETMKTEAVLDLIKKQFEKGGSIDETA